MSSLDVSDPLIRVAHDALLRNAPTRWLLLEYGHGPHVLVLSASGTGDVDELRTHLKDKVCYGVFREQTQDNKSLLISINYIPNSVKGVWRARALVHVTAVASKFKVHEVLNVSNPDQVSVGTLCSTLNLPPRVTQLFPSVPQSNQLWSDGRHNTISTHRRSPPSEIRVSPSPPLTRSPSPTTESHFHSSSPRLTPTVSTEKPNPSNIPSPPVGNSPFPPITPVSHTSSLLANISTTGSSSSPKHPSQLQSPIVTSLSRVPHTPIGPQNASWLTKQEAPLPSPPHPSEDCPPDVEPRSVDPDEQPLPSQMGSIPDSISVTSLHIPDPAAFADRGVSTRRIDNAPSHPIDGLPPSSLSSPLASQPTAYQLATEEIKDYAVINRVAAKDPGWVSSPKGPLSRFQERASSPADTGEEKKLVMLEEERRRRATERARREKENREEEEARQREFEERKEREKKKRLENARKSEERRVEQKRQQEEEEARRKAEKERKEAELRERRSRIKQRYEKQAGMDLLSGFITLESSSSWKRRYYRLSTEDWIFFKNDKDTTMPIHALELSRIQALREWNEGYDELEAIPNSFAVEFKDDAPCLFFADSAEDKEILLGLLNQAAGL